MTNTGELQVAGPRGTQPATIEDAGATAPATTNATASVKALARQVLEGNSACNSRATEAADPCNFSGNSATPEVAYHSGANLHGVALNDLRQLAGSDWSDIESDPAMLETFAAAVQARRMSESGEIPPTWTDTTLCAGCGPVPIWRGCPQAVLACPWCFNRVSGRRVPRRSLPPSRG